MNFESIYLAASKNRNVYITIPESPHWNRQGSKWLAQYFAKYAQQFSQVTIVGHIVDDWEHRGCAVMSWQEYLERSKSKNDLIVFSTAHNCVFAKEIEESGLYYTFDATAFNIDRAKISGDLNFEHEKEILDVYGLIKDSNSKNLYMQMLYARVFGDVKSIKPSGYPIYFNPYIKAEDIESDSIIIDGGSFDGKEAIKLRNFYTSCRQVDSYEFDVINYTKNLKDKIEDKVNWINKGLWNCDGFAQSRGSGISARVEISNSSDGVSLVSIDQNYSSSEKIGLIKLDIEGAEMEALMGAKETIGRCLPILLISIYHKPNDIWQIPTLIRSISERYEFRIGQHDRLLSETLLYGTINSSAV